MVLRVPYVDAIRLGCPDDLAAVLARPPEVVAVITRHAHTAAASTFAGRLLLVGPGVVSTSMLPWEGEQLIDPTQPPGVAFHVLHDDRRLSTHYRVVV